jgi:hypothetical protein
MFKVDPTTFYHREAVISAIITTTTTTFCIKSGLRYISPVQMMVTAEWQISNETGNCQKGQMKSTPPT